MANQTETKNLLCLNGWWYLRARIKGTVIKRSLETQDLAIARQKRDKILNELKLPENKKALLESVQIQLLGIKELQQMRAKAANLGTKLSDIWDKFQKDPSRREIAAHSLYIYKHAWDVFLEWMLKNCPHAQYGHQVTKAIGREFAAYCRDAYYAAETSRKTILCVRVIWKSICDIDDEQINPLDGVMANGRKPNYISKQIFTPEEMAKIFSPDNEMYFRLVSGFMYYLTLRWKEAVVVRWEQIRDGYFYGLHGKTGADADTRIPSQLQELIDLVPMEERKGLIFKKYNDQTKSRPFHYGNHLYITELEALGIEVRIKAPESNGHIKDKKVCVKGAHSFRHTAITEALSNGNNSASVRRLSGHATEEMQRRYTHLDADIAGDVAESLKKYW